MTGIFDFTTGTAPLLISIPHAGTHLPSGLDQRLTAAARQLPDTDWWVDRLYAVARDHGAYILKANYARTLVDLNRPADGTSLYPGQHETGICPLSHFDGTPIYSGGQEPDTAEIRERIARYWQPYHDQLAQTLDQMRTRWGQAILWDAHSIRSEVPVLFKGRLPDFNFGTNDGASCPKALAARLLARAERAEGYSAVLNGRFKGGYITRHYGQPAQHVTAIQLELAQSTYMTETPPAWDNSRASRTQAIIADFLEIILGT